MAVSRTTSAQRPTSIEHICEKHTDRVDTLLDALNLSLPVLRPVREAVQAKDRAAACRALLDYYRNAKTVSWLREGPVAPGDKREARADAILRDEITCYKIPAKVPRRPNGGLNWNYNGPNNDREWGWGLNRHYHLSTLYQAFRSTGNPAYVRGIDEHIRDWVVVNPYPNTRSATPPWRGLEAYMRVIRWARIFYGLQHEDAFTPATRILLLSSIPEHAHYLRHFHAGGGNWVTMEMYGLATAGVCWPEFQAAEGWVEYAVDRVTPELNRQVYPDGVQKELTSHYHWVALRSFERLAELLRKADRPVPAAFGEPLERMVNYLAYAMRPDGYGPLNNDSNRDNNRGRVLTAAKAYDRPDWAFIASNGKQGTKPEGPPSVVFPWAGQIVMRSGWDAQAHWAFFDVGPLGIGHQHYDKLHLSIMVHGRDVLVDAGRYTYVGGPWRRYFIGSPSHNVILIDGAPQKAYAREAKKPMSGNYAVTPQFDFARGTYDHGYRGVKGKSTHHRAVVHLRNESWIVVDRIETDRPRTIQPLWHFHPHCTVRADGLTVASVDEGKGNLRVVPGEGIDWKVDLIKGQEEPRIQGWYSVEYNVKQPGVAAVYRGKIDQTATFAWLLLPARGDVPVGSVRIAADTGAATTIDVDVPQRGQWRIGVPWNGPDASVARR